MKVKGDLFDQTINAFFRNELERMSQNLKKSSNFHAPHIKNSLEHPYVLGIPWCTKGVFFFYMSLNPALAIQMRFVLW